MSFQQELPESRVNITLDVDNLGEKKKKELPLKLLCLGNFFPNTPNHFTSHGAIPISAHNINAIMAKHRPSISLPIHNSKINLIFNSIQDFHPDNLVKQIPQCEKLIAMREFIKELRPYVNQNGEFKNLLDGLARDKQQQMKLKDEFERLMDKSNKGENHE